MLPLSKAIDVLMFIAAAITVGSLLFSATRKIYSKARKGLGKISKIKFPLVIVTRKRLNMLQEAEQALEVIVDQLDSIKLKEGKAKRFANGGD